MARRQEAKQDLILDAASRRFGQFGYAKTSVDEIARDLGIGKATIYHYFRSKEEILLNVVKREAEFLKELSRKALQRVATPPEKLRVFLQTHFEYLFDNIKMKNLTSEMIYNLQPIVDNAIREFYQEQLNMLKHILQEGIEKKYFRPIDPDSLAMLLLSLLRSLFTPRIILDPSISPQKLLDTFLTIVLKGVEIKST